MPTEVVLLSDVEPREDVMIQAVGQAHPDGTYVSFRGGQIRQFVDAEGTGLLAVFPTRPVTEAREAARALREPPANFGLWTDITIPYGDPTRGRAAAEAIAAAVGGVIAERA